MQLPEIKQKLSIQTVLAHYGLKPNRNNMLKCPFHEDENASLKIYTNTNTFNCFGCGANGDAIEFCCLMEGDKHKGILKATELCGKVQPINGNPKPTRKQTKQNHTEILTRFFANFQNNLVHPVSIRPKEYLQSRNLNYELLETGYNSGQFHYRGKLSETDKQKCIAAGLLIPYSGSVPNGTGTTYTAFAKDCIIFPLKDKQNRIVSIYGRSITDNSNAKHYYLKDRKGLYPHYPKSETTKLILTEAIIDAATLLQLPEITAEYEVLSCYGTNGLTEEHKQAIKGLVQLKEIIFFFDGDQAGQEAISKHAETLLQLKPDITISYVETPKDEDVNSLAVAYDTEPAESGSRTPLKNRHRGEQIFTHLLENRRVLDITEDKNTKPVTGELTGEYLPTVASGSVEPSTGDEIPAGSSGMPVEPEPVGAQAGRLNTHNRPEGAREHHQEIKLNVSNPEFIVYTNDSLQIIILGGINLQQLDRLRITLKISRTDTNDPLHSIRHTIDLYHSDYLEKFINKASEQLETGTNIIRRAIAELTEQIERYRLSKIESMKEQKPQARQLTEQRYRKAVNYLSAPKLMERTNQDIGRTGMIGETTNRLLMYLVFTSRLREQPLHIISLGASGTGKTYLQEKISELIPEQDKLEITILSENAFYYFDRKELKHKLVLIEDMDGAENVLYPLRELQSKKKISKTIPIKDSKGNMKTITLKVEGPISLAGTTTKERLYEDNANRSLLIYLDNTREHKELIMNYQRKLSAGKIAAKEEKQLIEFFKDMQTVLKPIKVRNPFAEYLVIPQHVFKPLRTNSHYLAFIETITFYHQYQRETKTDPDTNERYIETTLEDIEWANILLKDVLLAKADELPRQIREFFEGLKYHVKATQKESFYAKEIRSKLRLNPMTVNRYLRDLESRGYIRKVGGNRKAGYEYEVLNWSEYGELQKNMDVLEEILQKIKSKYNRSITTHDVIHKSSVSLVV